MPWASHQATGRTNHSGALKAKVIPPPSLQKVTILTKAINRNKPFCLACGSPLKPILWRTALQAGAWWWAVYIRGRCPRLLMVVPSRHQSACGFYFITDFTDWTDFTDFTVRGDCALMRPIGLGEYVTGICSRRVLAFPSDRLTHILPRQDIIRVQSTRMPHTSSENY